MEQTAGKEVPQQQEAFEFEAYQHPPAIPCEPVPFCPPMMPVFFMPCPPMPHFNPYGMHPGMQQGFPMMPPMHAGGDCGCGGIRINQGRCRLLSTRYQWDSMKCNMKVDISSFKG